MANARSSNPSSEGYRAFLLWLPGILIVIYMSGMQRIGTRCMEALYWLLQCHVYFRATCIGLLILPMVISQPSWADGSKDLIRNGGYRPFLEGGHGRTVAGINRMNKFYVYLRAGETLQLGSSALGMYEGDIVFTRPDGTSGSCLALKPASAVDN